MPRSKKGIILMALVMLIVFVSIAVLSVAVFIHSRVREEVEAKQLTAKCIYLAQAGIHDAVYFFRFNDLAANGFFSLGQTAVNLGENFTLSATAADLLMVNTSATSIGGSGNLNLLGLRIQNATNSNTITIDRMIVTWNNSRRLQRISINGSVVFVGNLSSPANANITNFTLNTIPTIYNIDYLRFSASMTGATISIQFVMTDGSTTDNLTVLPASQNYNFGVTSRGAVAGSAILRTVKAVYNALTGRIISYREL